MTDALHRFAIACASLLAVACASSAEQRATTQPPPAPSQDGQYQGDGTPEIETEQEAKDVAMWFLRGRGFLPQDRQVMTTVTEYEDKWFVGIHDPGDKEPAGSGVFVEVARSGLIMRVSFGR